MDQYGDIVSRAFPVDEVILLYMNRFPPVKHIVIFALGVLLLMLTVYYSVLHADFVHWDDDLLVFDNPAVRTINFWTLKQIFTTYDPELYIPLTLFTYQINSLMGGLDPFSFHVTNVILHAASAIILSGITLILTRKQSIAVVVGLLFAMHPLHSEAVSWISARKDVLAMMFFLLSILWYLLSQDRDKKRWYYYSLVFFLCALLSKVIVITLPVILILLDWQRGKELRFAILRNKVPYFALSIIFGIIALIGKAGQATVTTPYETFVMAFRSTVFYLQKIVAPFHLSVIYPQSGVISFFSPLFLISALLVVGISIVVFVLRKKCRMLLVAWLFFLITLAPTYPLYRKGFEGGDVYFASDRYVYIPSIAIILLLVVGLYHLMQKWRHGFVVVSAAIIIACSWLSYKQALIWSNSEALFTNAITLYPTAQAARNNLGKAYYIQGKLDEAEQQFLEAISVRPLASTYANLASLYRRKGDLSKAFSTYQTALQIDPADRDVYFGLGILFARTGQIDEAELAYTKAIALRPQDASSHMNLGALYIQKGDVNAAIEQYLLALKYDPFYVSAYFNLGMAYKKIGRIQDAREAFAHALQYDPSMQPARDQLEAL